MNKNLIYIILLIFLILILLRSQTANSEELYTKQEVENFNPYIGVLVNITDFENFNLIGVDLGYQIYSPYSLGVEISHIRQELNSIFFTRTNALVKGFYNLKEFDHFFSYTYVGLGLGSSFYDSNSNNIVVPFVGFDIPLSDKAEFFSLGGDVKYFWYTDIQDVNKFSASMILKYWF